MLKIGITGGIGSGKSTVAKIFEALNVPVYYADENAKKLMTQNADLIQAIKSQFGTECYHKNGMLNRKYLASIVFKDAKKLAQLNQIVHPAVANHTKEWQQKMDTLNVPYTLKEAALLYESESYKDLDKIIVVFADDELRMQRIMKRDGTNESQIKARIDKQMPQSEKIERADYLINNNGEQLLIPQVLELHNKFVTNSN